MAVISRNPRSADCVTVTQMAALKISYDDFWNLMTERSELALGVIQVLVYRLDEMMANLSRSSQRE